MDSVVAKSPSASKLSGAPPGDRTALQPNDAFALTD
jgi:hypothetical protein